MVSRKCPTTYVAQPYYEDPEVACVEEHARTIQEVCFTPYVRVDNDWNVPLIGSTATLIIPDVIDIPLGVYLYDPYFGYYEVVGYNPDTHVLLVRNNGQKGNQSIGTFIPSGTKFILTPEPFDIKDTLPYPYVAANFTVPNVNGCVKVTVTSILGLKLGTTVVIAGADYELASFDSANVITICNRGAGAASGSVIVALDQDGRYQKDITTKAIGICDSPKDVTGTLLVCNAGDPKLLSGTGVGQVLILKNSATDNVGFEYIDAETRVCAQLAATSIYPIGSIDPVTLTVSSTVGFAVNDVIEVRGIDLRFQIGSILSPTQLQIHALEITLSQTTIGAGSFICKLLRIEKVERDFNGVIGVVDLAIADNIAIEVGLRNTAINDALIASVATGGVVKTYADSKVLDELNARNTAIGLAVAAEASARNGAITDLDSKLVVVGNNAESAAMAVTDLSINGESALGEGASVIVQNTSTTKTMFLHYTVRVKFRLELFQNTAANGFGVLAALSISSGAAGPGVIGVVTDPTFTVAETVGQYFGVEAADVITTGRPITFEMTNHAIISMGPNTEMRLKFRGVVDLTDKLSCFKLRVNGIDTTISYLGVAV